MNSTIKNKRYIILNQWHTALQQSVQRVNIIHHFHPSKNLDKLQSLVKKLLLNRGQHDTINRLKAYRQVVQQYCLKQPVTPIPFCKAGKDGFPKAIAFLKPDRSDVNMMRYSLSIMRCFEMFRLKPEYDPSTIINKSTANEELISDICSFIESWPGIKILPELKPGNLVLSNKAGPNGPATLSCLRDLTALRACEDNSLLSAITELLNYSVPFLQLSMYDSEMDSSKEPIHSKLVLLEDKFGKTRTIAIADYFSNLALSGIHNSFMDALRKMRGDVTYLQNSIPSLVKELGNNLFSSDMTAFTDRFPIELEEKVVSAAYGERIGYLWKTVLTKRKFEHPLGALSYEVGNPMGVLSSWPVSTFTHHVVKRYCAFKLSIKDYKYLILGDDTLDSNKEVYDYYTSVIESLGVSISNSKCTQSKHGYAEFAKRLFIPDEEITGLPVHILVGTNRQPEQFLELYRICISRGYTIEYLAPCFDKLVSMNKDSKMLIDILALPKHITGLDPLWDPRPGTWAEKFVCLNEGVQTSLLKLSRERLFWDIVNNIDSVAKSKHTEDSDLSPTHPLIYALSDKINQYVPDEAFNSDFEEDEYWVYDRWMEGDYQHLVNIPNVDTYRYHSRGHRITKCNFDVFKTLLALASGDNNIPLQPRYKLSNQQLYYLALGRIGKVLDYDGADWTNPDNLIVMSYDDDFS